MRKLENYEEIGTVYRELSVNLWLYYAVIVPISS